MDQKTHSLINAARDYLNDHSDANRKALEHALARIDQPSTPMQADGGSGVLQHLHELHGTD